MTSRGGANNFGTVFRILTDGTGYIKLLDFAGASNGKYPEGSLYYDGNSLYGTTNNGGANDFGTIFRINTNGTGYMKLLDFAGSANGRYTYCTLVGDANYLYGMTQRGGTSTNCAQGCGTLFKIKRDGSIFVKLYDFDSMTGNYPDGSLILVGTSLYGTTSWGGLHNAGVIFKFANATTVNEPAGGNLISIHPNPFSTTATFQLPEFFKQGQLVIYNALGVVIKEKVIASSNITIDRDGMENGVYFVRVTSYGGTWTGKIIVE
jgi:uncharacterized repeat protein (TIGR03803 family)